jgi:hypothetical protein
MFIVLVAKADHQIVGFIIANLNLSLRKAIIENVYVRPEGRCRKSLCMLYWIKGTFSISAFYLGGW